MVSYPDLPGCITCGETIESALKNGEDAKKQWLAAAIEDGVEIYVPREVDSYSGQFKLRIPKNLHHSLTVHARKEGVSLNQYCLYLLSKNDVEYNRK